MKKILILAWPGSAYDSLRGLLELVAHQFAAEGLHVLLFPAGGEDWGTQLSQRLQQGDIGFALTMSGIGADVFAEGKPLWEQHKVPLFNWCCDHPCYFPSRHVIRSNYLLHGYVFPDHARYNLTHLHPNGIAYAVHLGIPPRSIFAHAPLPAGQRNGRIMFTKSGNDTNEIETRWRGNRPDIAAILFAAAEELMHRSTADFIPVLQKLTEPRGMFLHGNSALAMVLCRELDSYIRFRRADMMMRAVLPHPVDVFGSGWGHIPWDGAGVRAHYHGPVTWKAMVERLPAYTGCLSTNPLVEESVHDRVFFALAAGVPPISDSNGFSRAHMPALEPYAFTFSPDRINAAVDAVLAGPETAIARTEDAYQALSEPFGLRRAASQIVQFAAMYQLNMLAGL